jgi:hypothetical protein
MNSERLDGAVKLKMKPQKVEEIIDFSEVEEEIVDANDIRLDNKIVNLKTAKESDLEYCEDSQENKNRNKVP